jgi:hypothetical protein
MNKKKLVMTGAAVAVLAIAGVVLMSPFSMARVDKNTRLKARLKKPDITDLAFVGYNNWNYVMRNNGSYFYDSPDADENGNNAGGEFPRGSGTTIVFAAGVYIATIKNSNKVVSETEFATEFQPGRITNSGVPFDDLEAEDPAASTNQVYLIDRTLSGDDYANWPADAPVGPFGEPGLIADAQTWVVFNDLDVSLSQEGTSVSPDPGLGMQVVLESFAFNAGPLSDVVYLKFTITNMTNTDYANTYLGLWMDADVDNASNDIVGVDTTRGLGFVYNADASDQAFATGFDFFQGPVVNTADISATLAAKFADNDTILVYNSSLRRYVPTLLPAGQISLGATSFNTYANGTDPADNIERYNLLQGLFADGNVKDGSGVSDYYAFRGDPVTGTPPADVATTADQADQRILHGVGPFTLLAGSSQEIWAGVVGAAGTDRLNAVANMRNTDDLAQITFEAGLIAPAPPDVPKISVSSLDGAVVITWQNNAEFSEDIAGDILGINTANGYTANYVANDFQGYRVWKSRTGLPGSFTMLAEYDKNDDITSIVNRTINTAANLEIEEVRVGDDTGLQYSFTDHDVVNGQPYYYSVTAYDAQPYIAGPGSFNIGEEKWIVETEATGIILSDIQAVSIWNAGDIYLDSLAMTSDPTYGSNGGTLLGDTVYVEVDTHTVGSTPMPYMAAFVASSVEREEFNYDYNTLAAAFRQEGIDDPADIDVGDGVSFLIEFEFSDGHHESNIFRLEVLHISSFSGSIPTPSGLPISLETSPTANVVLVIPMAPLVGQNFEASVSDVTHTGPSDGAIEVEIVDPTQVQSVTYTLSHFAVPTDCTGAPLRGSAYLAASGIAYRVLAGSTILTIDSRVDDPRTYYDVNTNNVYDAGVDVRLDDSKFAFAQAVVGNTATEQPIVVDGMKITVFGPSNDVKFFQVISTGGGALAAPDMGAFAFNASGFPTIDGGAAGSAYAALGAGALNDRPNVPNLLTTVASASVANGGKWGIHTGEVGGGFSFDFFKSRTFRNDNFNRFIPYDFEMRFTAAGGMGHFAFTTGVQAAVPFEIWNIGINTPTDVSDDYRMYPRVLDDEAVALDNAYDLGGFDHSISGGDNDPYLDWVYFMNPANRSPGQAGYNASVAANGGALQTPNGEVMARTVLVNFNGGSVSDVSFPANVNQQRPANGTIFRIVSTKPNTVNDQFSFTGTARQTTASKSEMKAALKNAKVVPNPYYGRSEYQETLFDKRIKFINLPGSCTIRVFTVSGDLVATLTHNATSNNDRTNSNPLSATATGTPAETSVETWDLRNPDGKFVASGMYVAVIEAPGIGKKTLKFAVIQEEIKINGPDVR